MNLLIDDIRPFKEFLIRGCKEVRVIISQYLQVLHWLFLGRSVLLQMGVTCLLQRIQISFNSSTHIRLRTSAIWKGTMER